MNRKYIFIGVAFSVFLHTAFFTIPHLQRIGDKGSVKRGEKKCPVTAHIPKTAEEKIEKTAVTKPEAEKKKEQVKEVFKPASTEINAPAKDGDIKTTKPDDEHMPVLRLDISDYKTLVGAIKYFEMRVALIDKRGNFVDEIKLGRYVEIVPITEGLEEYSNRIRILPRGYFGAKIAGILRLRELKACVLVPAEVDKRFAELQREVIEARGRAPDEVGATDARFIEDGDKYNLVIEEVHLRKGKEDFL